MNLDDYKNMRIEEFKKRSDEILEAGFTYIQGENSYTIGLSKQDQTDILGIGNMRDKEVLYSIIILPDIIEWRDKSHRNKFYLNKLTELSPFVVTCATNEMKCLLVQNQLIDLVIAATTIEAVYAIEDPRESLDQILEQFEQIIINPPEES
jgi:hypothetical protein